MTKLVWKFVCWLAPRLFFKCSTCSEFSFELKYRVRRGQEPRKRRRICRDCAESYA